MIRTDPASGSQVEGGSTVILYIARPTRVTTTSVPTVEGYTEDTARSAISTANLVTHVVEQASDQPAGTVISQSPAGGTTVDLNSIVVIYVSTGVPEVVATPAPSTDANGRVTWQDEIPEGSGNWVDVYQDENGLRRRVDNNEVV